MLSMLSASFPIRAAVCQSTATWEVARVVVGTNASISGVNLSFKIALLKMRFIFICLFSFVPFILAAAPESSSLDCFNSCGLTNSLVYSF